MIKIGGGLTTRELIGKSLLITPEFELEVLKNIVSPKYLQRHYIKFIGVVAYIYMRLCRDRRYDSPRDLVEVHSKVLTQICNTRQRGRILDALLKSGLIKRNNSYRAESFCKHYGLGKALEQFKGISIIPLEQNERAQEMSSCCDATIEYLRRQLGRLTLSDHCFNYVIKKFDCVEAGKDQNLQKSLRDLTNLIQVFARTFPTVSRDKTGFRVHSFLTSLRRELRAFLTIRDLNEDLVNLDLKNSQLFFINYLIRDTMPNYECNPDCTLFEQLTSEGRFYEYVAEKMNLNDRDEAKFGLFKSYLFCKNGHCKASYFSFMSQYFPSVHSLVTEKKRTSYKAVAIELQRTESGFFIDRVVPRLMKELGELDFVATIHDSIVTNESASERVNKIILDEFSIDGFSPTIEIKSMARKGVRVQSNVLEDSLSFQY